MYPRSGGGDAEEDESLWLARWLLLLASGDYKAADQHLKARAGRDGEMDSQVWAFRAQLYRLRGDETELRRALVRGWKQPGLAGLAGTIELERALETGEWLAAVAAVDRMKAEDTSSYDRLYAAWALRMSGDGPGAGERLAALEADLAPAAAEDRGAAAILAMARHLARRASAGEVLAAARRAGFRTLPHAYFVLGAAREAAGDAAGARAFYEKAKRRALDLDLPYFMAAARAEG